MSENPYSAADAEHADNLQPIPGDALNWAMLCHLVALLAMPFGFGHIVAPLVVWLIKRDDHPFIDDQGKESLNFQISMTIYGAVLVPTVCIGVGLVLLPALLVVNVVFIVIASVSAGRGEWYRYPLSIRLVR